MSTEKDNVIPPIVGISTIILTDKEVSITILINGKTIAEQVLKHMDGRPLNFSLKVEQEDNHETKQ